MCKLSVVKKDRFVGFDILKCICVFLVIVVHSPFPGVVESYINALARVAVPIFFMITGFYYDGERQREKKNQIKKIFFLMLEANILFFVWKCLLTIAVGKNLSSFIAQLLDMKNIMNFLVFNDSPLGGHLWYLSALLYVLLIMQVVDKFNLRAILYALIPILLTCDLIMGKYSLIFWGREFPYIVVRNFLFVGVPYFLIGTIIKQIRKSISKESCIFCVVLFALTTVAERIFLEKVGMNATREHYISTTFMSIALFLMFKSIYESRIASCKIEKLMAFIGEKYSLGIYIIHPMLVAVFAVSTRKIGFYFIYEWIAPFVIFAMSVVLTALMKWMVRAIKRGANEYRCDF